MSCLHHADEEPFNTDNITVRQPVFMCGGCDRVFEMPMLWFMPTLSNINIDDILPA